MNVLFLLQPKNDVAFLYDNDSIRDGIDKMYRYSYTALPVINKNGVYVGTVNEGDILRYILSNNGLIPERQKEIKISGIIRKEWNPPVKVTASMDELLLQVMEQNFLPVVDDRGCFAGIITRKDIIKYFYDLNQENIQKKNAAV